MTPTSLAMAFHAALLLRAPEKCVLRTCRRCQYEKGYFATGTVVYYDAGCHCTRRIVTRPVTAAEMATLMDTLMVGLVPSTLDKIRAWVMAPRLIKGAAINE